MNQPRSSQGIDLAIVGGGPQALTLVTHLLQKRKTMRGRIKVFDPSGKWLHQWQQQFRAQHISHLRSPVVHHPAPNPYDLRRFAESRPTDLLTPYDRPTASLFQEFCQDLVQKWDLGEWILPHRVTRIRSLSSCFELILDNETAVIARRVVVATGSPLLCLPDWVKTSDRICHSQYVDLNSFKCKPSDRILIVGGGLTAGHLAIGALSLGCQVTMVTRRPLRERFFDTDPGWLGPKYLRGFQAEPDWNRRWSMIQSARDGGSLTPELFSQVKQNHHALDLLENCQVRQIQWCHAPPPRWQVIVEGGVSLEADYIWLATGYRFDVEMDPLFQDLLVQHPTQVVGGLPVLQEDLRWPGCQLYVMGGLAALHLGPTARNLSGARAASYRMVPSLLNPPALTAGKNL
jgi:cation diffusion facilitator CzcD-associated flavoprotein CzcO